MKFHPIFKRRYTRWEELERDIEQIELAKEKGDAFEQFAFSYFKYFQDIYQIKALYMGADIPEDLKRVYKLEKKDSGVDGLFLRDDGSSTAYQVKFRSAAESPSYDELTSFWAESEHTTERCIFANCYTLPRQAYKKKDQFMILRDSLTALDEDFFSWLYDFARTGDAKVKKAKLSPKPHQKRMIGEVLDGFVHADRGKLLAACGAGKTLMALWVKEGVGAHTVLFAAPNLALIKQTLEAWVPQASAPFNYLCVCSDQTVAYSDGEGTNSKKADGECPDGEDDAAADISYIGVPVTTEAEKIKAFLEYKTEKDKVIFSTYQSLDAIVVALRECSGFSFDIAFIDEAHRTAGTKDTKLFILSMYDEFIPCKKRLFMTATERFVNPRIVDRAKELDYEVFSMDNEEQYGRTFTSLPFREAIDQGIISDYKIVLCCMRESELKKIIQDNQIISTHGRKVDAQTLFKQVLLAKIMGDIGINKVISYHGSIESAKRFIETEDGTPVSDIISYLNDKIEAADVYAGHINGSMNAGERREIFDTFIQAPYGIISNARCLTEGVDVPIIDAVYFSDPKNSIVDIIQAVGRSLRKDHRKPDKTSYIIIPVIITDSVEKFEDIDPKDFSTLHSVIQALRDQDRILADYIDKLNLRAAAGNRHLEQDPNAPLIVELSEQLDLDEFSESLSLRIAEVNKDPSRIAKEFVFKKGSRTSGVRRTFRTVSDYYIDAYYQNLILPTLKKFDTFANGLPRKSIEFCHNNISHCVKIGALTEKDGKYYVTDIGKAFFEYRDLYIDIFKEQMLKYYEIDSITRVPKFPYRMALRVIAELGYITKLEFICSLYAGKHFGKQGEQEAIKRVRYLRTMYPKVEILNEANKRIVMEALNAKLGTTLKFEDIWTSSTTVYNQFKYIFNHLQAWDDLFEVNARKYEIRLRPGGAERIAELLDQSAEMETCPMDSLRRNYTQYKGY